MDISRLPRLPSLNRLYCLIRSFYCNVIQANVFHVFLFYCFYLFILMRCIFERQVEQLFVFNTALPSVNLTDKCVPCGSVPDCCIVNRYGIPCMLSHLRCSKQTVVSTTGSYVSRAGQGKTANTHNQYRSEMSCMQKNTRLTYSNWLQHWGMAYPGMYAHVKQINKSAYLVEHIGNIFFIDNSHKILAA